MPGEADSGSAVIGPAAVTPADRPAGRCMAPGGLFCRIGATAVLPRQSAAMAGAATSATSTVQTPAKSGLKKVSLGGIAKKESDTSNKYPVFPDETGAAGELAARIAERQEQFEALKSVSRNRQGRIGPRPHPALVSPPLPPQDRRAQFRPGQLEG